MNSLRMNGRHVSRIFYSWLVLLLCSVDFCVAQAPADSLASLENSYPVKFYHEKLNASAPLFNGREYNMYRAKRNETPYQFLQWTMAELEYDGQHAGPLPIMIDLSSGNVIINFKGGFLQLVKEKLSLFKVKGRTYVYLHPDGLTAGFYEQLYNGTTKIYSYRWKKFKERLSGNEIIPEFEEHIDYYVRVNGRFHRVNNRNDVLSLLPDRATEMKTFMRKNGLRVKRHIERDLMAWATYCDKHQ